MTGLAPGRLTRAVLRRAAQRVAAAVAEPVWVIFLGRKSCPPGRPVLAGVGNYPDLAAALIGYDWPSGERELRGVVGCGPEAASVITIAAYIRGRLEVERALLG